MARVLVAVGLVLKRVTILFIGLRLRRSSGLLRVLAHLVAVGRRTTVIGAAAVVAGSDVEDLGRVFCLRN